MNPHVKMQVHADLGKEEIQNIIFLGGRVLADLYGWVSKKIYMGNTVATHL